MKKKSDDTPKDWHRADIVAALKKAGWSVAALSREAGYDKATLYTALLRPYPNAEKIIAKALDKKPEEIWPERYAARTFKPKLSDTSHGMTGKSA